MENLSEIEKSTNVTTDVFFFFSFLCYRKENEKNYEVVFFLCEASDLHFMAIVYNM